MSTGTILLLGGTGKVASEIAPLLHPTYPVLLGSRSGTSPDPSRYTGVRFDWDDKSTWDAALSAGPTPVAGIWIVAPGAVNPGPAAKEFIDLARGKGARRFVLLSATAIEDGGPALGQIHECLRELGDQGDIEWAVLRPTWFQENFSTAQQHIQSIKGENKVYSATGSGKIPWVATRDIAAVAHHALTVDIAPNKDFLVLGEETLSYADAAKIFTEVLGRDITHHELTEKELAYRYQEFGVPEQYAGILASMDTTIKNGGEDRVDDTVISVTGKRPQRFREFVDQNKAVWQ